MGIKKIGYGTHLFIYSIIVLAILMLVNIIFTGYFQRIDLTENKIYSVSKATKEILKGLDDVINIQIYFSKDQKMPPQILDLKRQVVDLLDEYSAYGGSKLIFEFIDPEDDPELSQRMQFMGIPKVQVNIFQKDKAEVATIYLGMSIMFEDRQEVIPVIQNVKNLEYDLTSAILKVTKKRPEAVGFVTWHKEELQQEPFSKIQMALQKQYEVKNVSLTVGASGLEDTDTLVIIAPEEITDAEKRTLDQFLLKGGREIYLIDMVRLKKSRQLEVETVNTNITELLANYGFKLNPDLVADRSNSMAAFSGGFFSFQVPYPLWPKVVKDGFAKDNPAVSELDTITLPWTSSVRINEGFVKEKGLKATILAKTTPHGWTQKGRFDLNPQQGFMTKPDKVEQIPLVAMISGSFESFQKGKKSEAEQSKDPNEKESEEGGLMVSEKESHIVVIGNSRLIEDDFIGRFPENMTFFLNVVDWLTMGEKLIGIRSRERTERPIKEMSDKMKAFIRYLNIFGISLLLIFFGIVKYILKKRRRSAII